MSEELKPCPFCGHTDIEMYFNLHPRCIKCGCSQDKIIGSKAIKSWNKRAPITLDQAKQVLAEAGMAAVPIKDCIDAANTMECRDAEEDATHMRFMKIQDAAVISAQEKPDA